MSINVFEGARRIAKLIAILWVIGVSISQFQSIYDPYIDMYFQVDSPSNRPIRRDDKAYQCEVDDATEYLSSLHTTKGIKISARLCFKANIFSDGRKLIPTKQVDFDINEYKAWLASKQPKEMPELIGDEGLGTANKQVKDPDNNKLPKTHEKKELFLWGNEKYSTEVTKYTQKVADRFKLSKADEEWADNQVWSARREKINDCMLYIVGGLAFIWMFSWIVGWIVRGFFGIPSGHDYKP